MKRSLRFWTRFAGECLGMDLVITVILLVLTAGGADDLGLQTLGATLPLYLCVANMLLLLMLSTGVQALYIPLLLGMGETRRNSLLGFQCFRAMVIALTLALCALVWLLVPGQAAALGNLPGLLCLMVAVAGLSNIIGSLFMRWKWVGVALLVVISGGVGGMVGVLGGSAREGFEMTAILAEVAQGLQGYNVWLALGAVALLALDVGTHWLLLRRAEVKL